MNRVLVICGPTASGKSAFALKLAEHYQERNPVIINADSMQLYKDIAIIAASPTEQDKALITHELYGILKAQDYCSVADYVKIASQLIQEKLAQGRLPIIVGGTGMYVNALMFGYSPIPDIDPALRLHARKLLKDIGNENFFVELIKLDPLVAEKLNPGDSQRILRAYEVIKQSGKSIVEYHALPPIQPLSGIDFKVIMLSPERDLLYKICNERFLQLLEKGALQEIQKLMDQNLSPDLQVFKALGVTELISYLKGDISLEESIKLAQTKTRQYAKRQVTWFTHQIPDKTVLEYKNFEEYESYTKVEYLAKLI
jgi:tRNA dimethylallyltransferase